MVRRLTVNSVVSGIAARVPWKVIVAVVPLTLTETLPEPIVDRLFRALEIFDAKVAVAVLKVIGGVVAVVPGALL